MRRRGRAFAEHEKTCLEIWHMKPEKVYSEDDVPEWVLDRLGGEFLYDKKDIIRQLAAFVRKYESNRTKQICIIGKKYYFRESGYRKIIGVVRRREMLRPEELERWEQEAFGAGE